MASQIVITIGTFEFKLSRDHPCVSRSVSGYFPLQVVGGYLATRFGGKYTLLIAVLLPSLFTMVRVTRMFILCALVHICVHMHAM
jgi:hypothetical protein